MVRKTIGYCVSLVPLLASLAIAIRIAYFVPQPLEPPNQTLQGVEIIFPVSFGVLLAFLFGIQIPFKKAGTRKDLAIWTGLAIAPLILLALFLYVPFWIGKF
jgi:hypothetical protein